MEGSDCDRKGKLLGGVTIFSHPWTDDASSYADNIECRLTFKAEKDDWKLMMRVVELDIPDKSFSELCNDAVYVYDASNIMGRPVVSLCRAARSHKLLVPPLPVFHQPFNVFVLGGKSNFQASCGLDFGRKKKKKHRAFLKPTSRVVTNLQEWANVATRTYCSYTLCADSDWWKMFMRETDGFIAQMYVTVIQQGDMFLSLLDAAILSSPVL